MTVAIDRFIRVRQPRALHERLMKHKVKRIDVHLVSTTISAGYTDATRKFEIVTSSVVRFTTGPGLKAVGLPYHEVPASAARHLILRRIAPKLIDPHPLA